MSRTFFAHSAQGRPPQEWQTLKDHLECVGEMAGRFAEPFGGQHAARAGGRLHDLGKYTERFQRRLEGAPVRVDHSMHGARVAMERLGPAGKLLAYAIAGHHAGLADGELSSTGSTSRRSLRDRLEDKSVPALDPMWEREIALPEGHCPFPPMKGHARRERYPFQLAFLTRMLFSCIVDADYLDTEAYYEWIGIADRDGSSVDKVRLRHAPHPDLAELRTLLDVRLARFASERPIDRIRAEILTHVRGQAGQRPGLFSLTVPTGGGKTLASLAFALDHAIRHGLQRIIYVIPFTSIVEQTANVFRDALGELGTRAVLEHHSAFNEPDPDTLAPAQVDAITKLRLAMENWDVPIVVTTSVQFFESLFASRPSRCRKLHSIAGSVVIIDEAQTIPLPLLRPTLAALDELARNYRCSPVLCTATQPALGVTELQGVMDANAVVELAPDPPALYQRLQRVRVRHVGRLDDDALADRLASRDQVLCIVNNRRHARQLYRRIAALPGARHLSTLMYAAHRSEVLQGIRADLDAGRPCRVIATSLVEAGVDISFPLVLRAEAGLDSIAQAAGRCNRNMERSAHDSEVLVYEPGNPDGAPPAQVRQAADAMRSVIARHGNDLLAPAAIQAYFDELFFRHGTDRLDQHDLLALHAGIDTLPFDTVSRMYRFIEDVQATVIVPGDDQVRGLLKSLEHADRVGDIARGLQRYLVQVPQRAFLELCLAGAVQAVRRERFDEQFMQLCNLDLYSTETGLWWEEPTFMEAAGTVF